jgi:hypothetical protein
MRNRVVRCDRWLVLTLAFMLALVAAARGQQRRPRSRGSRWATPEAMKNGAEAPDFELPQLVYETDDKGNQVARITDKKTRLSSYEGEKVVCVFMSSYT